MGRGRHRHEHPPPHPPPGRSGTTRSHLLMLRPLRLGPLGPSCEVLRRRPWRGARAARSFSSLQCTPTSWKKRRCAMLVVLARLLALLLSCAMLAWLLPCAIFVAS